MPADPALPNRLPARPSRMPHSCRYALAATALAALLSACGPKPAATTSGIDLAGMDKSVAPGDDFNAYANGGWIKATPIPADKSEYGAGTILTDLTRQRLLALIQDSAKAGASAGDVVAHRHVGRRRRIDVAQRLSDQSRLRKSPRAAQEARRVS